MNEAVGLGSLSARHRAWMAACLFLISWAVLSIIACQNPLDKVITAKISDVADTRLAAISVSLSAGATFTVPSLSPAFDPEVTSYTVSGDTLVTKAVLSASLSDGDANLEYRVGAGSWNALSSGGSTGTLDLPAGTTRLSLRVTSENDLRARVYTIDAVVPKIGEGKPAVLLADSPLANAYFGDVVSMSDDSLVLAASNVAGAGVDVFTRASASSAWTFLRTLTASGATISFGSALSVSGDGRIVAAGSRQNDKKVWLFNVETGALLATLDAGAALGTFGFSVALSHDASVLAVGHDRYYDNAVGSIAYGRVCIYRSADAWASITAPVTIEAPEQSYTSGFGYSLALSADGNTLVIGAPNLKSGSNSNAGCAYIYECEAGTWSSGPTILTGPSDFGYYFGSSVDIFSSSSGTLIISGAPGEAGGEAILFSWDGDVAVQVGDPIKPPIPQTGAAFGLVVALSADGRYAVVGSPFYDDPVKGHDAGAAYLFAIGSDSWTYEAAFNDPYGEADGHFGNAVCLGSGLSPVLTVGSPWTTVRGTASAGAVFVF